MNRWMLGLAALGVACGGGGGDDKDTVDQTPDGGDADADADSDSDTDADADADSDADSDADTDTGTTTDPDADDDNDGWTVGEGDCNDHDAAINPAAQEPCDGLDNDCSGSADEVHAVTLNGSMSFDNPGYLADYLSGNNNVIVFCPGTHDWGGVSFTDHVTIMGSLGAGETTLQANGRPIVTVRSGGMVELIGVTLTGSDTAGAVVREDGELLVRDSRITGNGETGLEIADAAGAVVRVEQSVIDLNGSPLSGYDGGGVHASGAFDLTLLLTTLDGNGARNGGGLWAETLFGSGTVALNYSTLSNNQAGTGGGLVARNVTINGSNGALVENNHAQIGGGGLVVTKSRVTGVTVRGNSANVGGGVAIVRDPMFDLAPIDNRLIGVFVDGNTAIGDAGGVYVGPGVDVTMTAGSMIVSNDSGARGGGAFIERTDTLFRTEYVDWGTTGVNDNTPNDVQTFGAIYTYQGAGAVIECIDAICSVL
ncbi:MAG: right-handed parallel beta-helix repeat-containing protein [Alphaproteobacteria bacterium]|nr:right-handed parallel beta-helix repeat-containing protein [Alphaproteobacteria bacterium]